MSESAPGFLERAGPMADIYRSKDWSDCELGGPSQWPEELRGYIDMIVRLPTPAVLFWGPNMVQLYNLGYSDIMGPRHPKYLGRTLRECWPDTYDTVYPMMRRTVDAAEVANITDALIPVTRYGFTEETYFTFSFVPLRARDGKIAGLIQPITETTREVIARRRLTTINSLTPRVNREGDALEDAVAAFGANDKDLPFVAVYLGQPDGTAVRLAAKVGVSDVAPALESVVSEVMASLTPVHLQELAPFLESGHVGPWPEPTTAAYAVPLRRAAGTEVLGALVIGISSRLTFDELYRTFFDNVAQTLASNLAFERENREKERLALELQRRADALTELDRAKTAFFSNVSHEFRTPLTLMLGPLDDALADPSEPIGPKQRERLELIKRSGGRLFKLVNTLLDFSRIEAGRSTAAFEPVDLAELTTDLASSFRSLLEGAGLRLTIDCPALPETIWVDREMWEKIVLNLLSNAFKFTLEGEISVSLAWTGSGVELRVRDTGTGVPTSELPKLFERFHRVEGAKGRSFEGTGIGLALVQDLVRMHGGEVSVESAEGSGSTFFVRLRAGSEHLPEEHRHEPSSHRPRVDARAAFLREAQVWATEAPGAEARAPALHVPALDASERHLSAISARILVADDNPDMRDYIRRLLLPEYEVETAADGREALEAIRRSRPDLVLSDVMMPTLDGFGLVAAIRADARLQMLPIILLSARAGEEARVEGIEAGADDYLVKPFAARELLARVSARLEIARLREEMAVDLERLVRQRTAQLTESNMELESFSYSVSHDLRAPLRHILGFSQLLERSSSGKLDPKSQQHLTTIIEAARRGGQLVDDLLAFSRLGRTELLKSRVDLDTLVAEAREELAPEVGAREIAWEVRPLPTVQGDPAMLKLVFKNLLSNALKYTRTKPHATISVEAIERPEEHEIVMRDNGVGFDMRYIDKLFNVFQRLHTSDQFEGTGIGLALVRRIIGRHGGRTWAEGKVGEGARIHVALPRASPRPERAS